MPRRARKSDIEKRRILLLCAQPLLGDGLQAILGGLKDVELIGPLVLDVQALERVTDNKPDVMLIADDGAEPLSATSLTARILERYPDIPVIRVGLEQDTIRLYTSQTLPARSADLIEAIRRLPAVVAQQPKQEVGALKTQDSGGHPQ